MFQDNTWLNVQYGNSGLNISEGNVSWDILSLQGQWANSSDTEDSRAVCVQEEWHQWMSESGRNSDAV